MTKTALSRELKKKNPKTQTKKQQPTTHVYVEESAYDRCHCVCLLCTPDVLELKLGQQKPKVV